MIRIDWQDGCDVIQVLTFGCGNELVSLYRDGALMAIGLLVTLLILNICLMIKEGSFPDMLETRIP